MDHRNIQIRFGARVRQMRLALKLSQEDLAARCRLDRTYISGIERGVRNVSLKNIERLAAALGESISSLTQGL